MKMFDRLSDIERHIGCSIKVPDWYGGEQWLIFESDEPYTYRFVDYSTDIDIHKNSDYSKDWLVLNPNTFYKTLLSNINMEKYIASYKHLIGCEHVLYGYGLTFYFTDKNIESIVRGFDINKLRFYLDDETSGIYKEYMQLHYPEYEHIWKHQL